MPRPRTPLLSRDRIADEALTLVETHGDFTVTQLARALKVTPSSLYHHVTGRDDVVDLIRVRIGQEIDASGLGRLPWDEALTSMARSYRLAFARRPAVVRLLATSPVRDLTALDAYDRMAAALLGAGFPQSQVLALVTALDNFVLGSALDLAAEQPMWRPDAGAHAALARVVDAVPAGVDLCDLAFETGLQALLTGFRALLAR